MAIAGRFEEFARARATALRAALIPALLAAIVPPALAQATSPPPPAASKIEVTDEAGRRASVPVPVRRIISLAPNLTETIYALGAGDRLVGDTDFCDYPPDAKQKPHVGGAVNPNLEQIVDLKPDLVLATKSLNRKETVDALEQLGLAVYATAPRNVLEVLESVRHIGELIGEQERSDALVAGLQARLDELKRKLAGRAPRRVLFIVWTDPLVTIGKQTFLADALRWAGAESVVDVPQEWPRLSLEEVVRLQPEFLVFADSHSEGSEAASARVSELTDLPGWRGLDAVRLRRIAVISDAVNRPAPRLVDAIEQLARLLNPEAFAEKSENGKRKLEICKPLVSHSQFPTSDFKFEISNLQFQIPHFQFQASSFPLQSSGLQFPFSIFHFPSSVAGGAR